MWRFVFANSLSLRRAKEAIGWCWGLVATTVAPSPAAVPAAAASPGVGRRAALRAVPAGGGALHGPVAGGLLSVSATEVIVAVAATIAAHLVSVAASIATAVAAPVAAGAGSVSAASVSASVASAIAPVTSPIAVVASASSSAAISSSPLLTFSFPETEKRKADQSTLLC